MRRFAANLALLFVLGAFTGPAWANVSVNQHACCIRAKHHCGSPALPSSTARVRSANDCCSHCVPSAVERSATAPALTPVALQRDAHPYVTEFLPLFDATQPSTTPEGRAPPATPPGQ